MNNLITAGELAKLAGTTKRTVLWYDQKGVLTPKEVSTEGIRLYSENQVLDYQKVLLLTDLGVSLKEIKEYLDNSLDKLFNQFVITRLLFIFKQFGSISIENAQKTKQEFIDQFEASLTLFEKEQFKKAFDNFPAFKLYVIQFYNIKLVKLELLITHKIEINESEFKDYILINS